MLTEMVSNLLIDFSGLVRPYLNELGLAMMATVLVVFGNDLMLLVRKQIGGLNLILRLSLFVVFCALVFGLLMSLFTPWVMTFVADIDDLWLGVTLLIVFFVIAYLAKRRGAI